MDKVQLTFRFVGDHVDPQHITEIIGMQPSAVRTKGGVGEAHPERRYPTGYWGIDSNRASEEPLVTHLHSMMDRLASHLNAIHRLKGEGYEPSFFCGLFYTGVSGYFKLDTQTLSRLAQFEASLEINVYNNDQ